MWRQDLRPGRAGKELDRLQEILSLADDGAFHADEALPFGPVTWQIYGTTGGRGEFDMFFDL